MPHSDSLSRAKARRASPGPARGGSAGRTQKQTSGRGKVVVDFVEPMAAQPAGTLPEGREWLYEVKWDGFRALILKDARGLRLLSRNNKSLAERFPEVLASAARMAAAAVIVDGEIVALGADGKPSFEELQHREIRTGGIEYYAFDLLHVGKEDLRGLPLRERRTRLARVLAGTGLRLSPELKGSAAEVITAVSKLGLEGVIAKRRDGIYRSGERHADWRKLRLASEQEFVIGGFRPGMEPFESILVGYYDAGRLIFAAKVRPGFSPASRQLVWDLIKHDVVADCPFDNLPDAPRKGRWGEGLTAAEMAGLRWVKPRVVVQIAFLEWTRQGHLRHSSFRGVRADKRPREVVRETP